MRETDHLFLDDLILPDRARHARHLHVRRKELADEMIAIEGTHAIAAYAAGHGRHMIEMRVFGHRFHRRVEIAGELRAHMFLEQLDHRVLR
jgi:hypothetical protein